MRIKSGNTVKEERHKKLITAMKIVLVISLIPWAFTLCVSIMSFFAGTDAGLFEAATKIYGIEAFLYTIEIYLFVFMPVYVITAITAVISTMIIIVQKKKCSVSLKSSPKVIMTCGKICSGKSTLAQKLRLEYKAVILSVDDITLALLGQDPGGKLDGYVEKLKAYFFEKSVEITETGTNVILEWGFWTKAERDQARKYYTDRGIAFEFHYIDISDEEWERRLKKRNAEVTAGRASAYYVDDGLKAKFASLFEPPDESETDVIINT